MQTLVKRLIEPASRDMDFFLYTPESGKALTPNDFAPQFKTPPFLSKKRVFLLRNTGWFGAGASKNEELLELLDSLDDRVCVIFREDKVDKKQKIALDRVKKVGRFCELSHPTAEELQRWVMTFGRHLKIDILPEAAASLVSRCESSMSLMARELKKFQLYCAGKQQTRVDTALVEYLSVPDLSGSIFHLTDLLLDRRMQEAYELVDNLLAQGQPVILILFNLARQVKQLYLCKSFRDSVGAAQQLKLPPFVVKRLLAQSRRLSEERLLQLYELCFRTDWGIKSGRVPERLGLELLMAAWELKDAELAALIDDFEKSFSA